MTNGTTSIEEVEAELSRSSQQLEQLAAAAADLGNVTISLGEDDAALFERLSSLGQDAASPVALPSFAIAV